MYYDLNIKLNEASDQQKRLEEIFTQLVEYGYRGVAVTVEIDDVIFASKKEKSKNNAPDNFIPKPINIKGLKEKFPKLNIYRRINVVLNESENIRKVLNCGRIKAYDLISFQPENTNVLKSLLSVTDIDIISYNPESRCSLLMTRKMYNQIVNQNVYFELMYVPAINSQSARRNLITLFHKYHAIGKAKNVIVTSGAELPHHIRGPYDVMNFNLLFGLSEEEAKKAITKNCESILLKSRKQRLSDRIFEIKCTEGNTSTEENIAAEPMEE